MASNGQKRILIVIAAIIGLIIFALILSFGIDRSGIKGLVKEAEQYMKEEDYESAADIYSRLISKTGDKVYRDKKEDADKLAIEYNYYSLGLSKLEKEEFISAIKNFQKIDREDSIYYKKAAEQLVKIEEEVINEAKLAIGNDNTYLASSILNDYIKIVGKSEEAEKILSKLDVDDLAQVDPTDENDKDEKEDKDNKIKDMDIKSLPSNPKDWIGTSVEIQSGKANLRDKASLESKVVGIAVEGDVITISKIYDDGNRTWCYGKITNAKTGKLKMLGYQVKTYSCKIRTAQ